MSLSAENLALSRGEQWLVKGVAFTLAPGMGLLVQGANGCGKSTLLRTLCGLRAVQAGTVRWHGQPYPAALQTLRAELLYLGHADAGRDDLTPRENLHTALAVAGEPCTQQHIDAALRAAGLERHAHLRGRALSQGLRRRAALARLWATRRRLWVLDEPLAGLDTAATEALVERLRTHLHTGGIAVLSCHTDTWTHAQLPLQSLLWA